MEVEDITGPETPRVLTKPVQLKSRGCTGPAFAVQGEEAAGELGGLRPGLNGRPEPEEEAQAAGGGTGCPRAGNPGERPLRAEGVRRDVQGDPLPSFVPLRSAVSTPLIQTRKEEVLGSMLRPVSGRIQKRVIAVVLIFPACQGVLDTGKKLSDDNTIGKEEIQQRLAQFVEHWKELKQLATAR